MRRMVAVIAVLALVFGGARLAAAQKNAEELKTLLHEFLAAAGRSDKVVFDRFFADDLIYTRSAGVTISKADIMKGLNEPAKPDDPMATYNADDITVHDYGDMAVVNFRLIQHINKGSDLGTYYFRNTGTFLKRNGEWQAVAWQSTRVPKEGQAPNK
jgi:ketosteroid isomerase-like protein